MFDKQEIVAELNARLDKVVRSASVKPADDFDLGIDCCLANEQMWLRELLAKIENSEKENG